MPIVATTPVIVSVSGVAFADGAVAASVNPLVSPGVIENKPDTAQARVLLFDYNANDIEGVSAQFRIAAGPAHSVHSRRSPGSNRSVFRVIGNTRAVFSPAHTGANELRMRMVTLDGKDVPCTWRARDGAWIADFSSKGSNVLVFREETAGTKARFRCLR